MARDQHGTGVNVIISALIGLAVYNTLAASPETLRAAVVAGAATVLGAVVADREARTHSLLHPSVLLLYFQTLTLPLGLLAYLELAPIPNVAGLEFSVNAHALALLGYVAVTVGRVPLSQRPRIRADPFDKFPFLVLLALGLFGAWRVSLQTFDYAAFIDDPFAARAAIQSAAPSGVMWLLYKTLLVTAALVVAMRATRRIGIPLAFGILGLAALAYLSYGARLMPLLLALVIAMSWHRFIRPIPTRRVVVAVGVLAAAAVVFSGYRYVSNYGLDLDRDRLVTATVRQASGTVAEVADTAAVTTAPSPAARAVLTREVYAKSVPSAVRDDTAPGATFGDYVARVQGRLESGGLRVGAIGEVSLAYGLWGALLGGAALGVLARLLSRVMASRHAPRVVVSIIGTTQVLFVMVTGVANVVSSVAVVVLTAVFARACFPPMVDGGFDDPPNREPTEQQHVVRSDHGPQDASRATRQ